MGNSFCFLLKGAGVTKLNYCTSLRKANMRMFKNLTDLD
jgi:hypothetical protein